MKTFENTTTNEVLNNIKETKEFNLDSYLFIKYRPHETLEIINLAAELSNIDAARDILKGALEAVKSALDEGGHDISSMLMCITKLNELFDFN